MSLVSITSIVFLALGGVVMLIGAAGVWRFPDFYTRLHAAGKGDTLGQALVLLGLAIPVFAVGFSLVAFKLLLIMLFVFVFNPTATHALARGAWIIGLKPWTRQADGTAPAGGHGQAAPVSDGAEDRAFEPESDGSEGLAADDAEGGN